MFVETVTCPRSEWETVLEKAQLVSSPPAGLRQVVAWEAAVDQVTVVLVWDTPAARGDWAEQRMMSLVQTGQVKSKISRVKPVLVYPGVAGSV